MNRDIREVLSAGGFKPFHTGGGLMAWKRDLGDGSHELVSADDGLGGDPFARVWLAGRYDNEDATRFRETNGPRDLATALYVAAGFPRP